MEEPESGVQSIRMKNRLRVQALLPDIGAGVICGVIVIIVEISFAALIFSGDLSPFVSRGIGFTLFGTLVIGLAVTATSSIPGAVAISQDVTAALLGVGAAAMAASMPSDANGEEVFFSVAALIALSSFLTGLFFFAIGWFRIGNLIRFIPYPVVGGFLAGIGWLLLKGGIGIMADAPVRLNDAGALLAGQVLMKWLPGFFFAVVLMVLLNRVKHYLTLPAALIGAVALFYLLLPVTGLSVSEAEAQGWLLGPFPEGAMWQPLTPAKFPLVHWGSLLRQAGTIGSIALLAAISLLLNCSGLEITLRRDIDPNRELKVNGLANVLACPGSGPTGFTALSFTALGHRLGASSRVVGLTTSLLVGAAFFLGASTIGYLPRVVLGAFVVFLGLTFLWEWIYEGWFRLSKPDYALIIVIVIVIEVLGFLQGVGLGILASVAFFVLNYSRSNVVRHELSGTTFQSSVDRSIPSQRLLAERGGRIHILRLQGFLFFGTASNLLNRVSHRINDPDQAELRYLVLDFHRVRGMDSSAVNCFARMHQKAEANRFYLVFTGLTEKYKAMLLQGGVLTRDEKGVCRSFPDVDHGMEWCEGRILAEGDRRPDAAGDETKAREDLLDSVFDDLMRFLDQREMFEQVLAAMQGYLERLEVASGAVLIRQGDPQDFLFFLESGKATARMAQEHGNAIRLQTMNPGTVVGELGLYLGYKAQESVVADQPSVLYRLSSEALSRAEQENPDGAALFHKFIVLTLSERLMKAKATLRAVLE